LQRFQYLVIAENWNERQERTSGSQIWNMQVIGCSNVCVHLCLQVDEWWEQPASNAIDWITVDGQNVAAWLAHVKQLQATFYEKQLL
jgi:hypothetical protein